MKTMIRLLSLAALATACTLPTFAQATPTAAPAAQSICEEEARTTLYTDYYNSKKGDAAAQKHAREVAGTYIQKYGAACDDTYSKAVQKFIDIYDTAVGDLAIRNKLAGDYEKGRYPEAVADAKQILAKTPDDVKITIIGAWSAYQAVATNKNPAFTGDARNLAQQALQLLQAGKTADSYLFKSKEEAQSWMEYVLAALNVASNPAETTPRLIKLAQSATSVKEEPSTYTLLARTYEDEYKTLSKKYAGFTTETDESKLVLANINQTIDRIIDAYARAIAYSTKPEQQAGKADLMKTLTELYKSRHNNSETGLNEMLAAIKTTPLLVTEPLTTLPAETPAGAPSGDSPTGTKPPMTTMPTTTASPMAAQPMATQPKPAQPAATATPKPMPPTKKPPVKRHHA